MAKEILNNAPLSVMVEKKDLPYAAIAGDRMLTTDEAENILSQVLSDYLFQINLN